jgi:Protein kinase domain
VGATPYIPGHRITDVIGKGGFATVYRGWQVSVGREVAVKVDNRVLLSERDQRRFVREVTAAGRLSGHPHVIGIHDAGTLADGRPYMVMEFCPGGSLADAVRRDGAMSPAQVRDIGVKIADALAAAHAVGVLHRDVKPGNILLNRYGMVGLSDFGLASILASEGEQSVTREALTPAYAPPENFRGEEPAVTGDLYSLAATLYDLLAGRPPRYPADGSKPSIAMLVGLHDEPVDDIPGVPPDLMATLRRSLAADPAVRPRSAVELRDALSGASAGASAGVPAGVSGSGPEGAHLTLTMPSADVPAVRSTPPPTDTIRVAVVPGRRRHGVPGRRRPKGRLAALAAAAAVIIAAAAVFGAHVLSHGAQAAPQVSKVLYSFTGGSTDGWRAGANAASVTTVTTFADGPGHPYASNYALDAAGGGGFVPVPVTMTVTPATPLNLSAANAFYLYVDGFGYAPYAKSYAATVTLASGSHTLSRTVAVSCNAWNHVVVEVGSWPYRDHVTGVSVSYKGIAASSAGATTPWYAHFQIDDVGYTTG